MGSIRSWCSSGTDDLNINTIVNRHTQTPPSVRTPPTPRFEVGQIVECKKSRWESWKLAKVRSINPLRCVVKGSLIRTEYKFVRAIQDYQQEPLTWKSAEAKDTNLTSTRSLDLQRSISSLSSDELLDNAPDLPVTKRKVHRKRPKKQKFAKAKAYLLGTGSLKKQKNAKKVPVKRNLGRSRTLEC